MTATPTDIDTSPPDPDLHTDEQDFLLTSEQATPVTGFDYRFPPEAGRIRWINFIFGAAVLLPWNVIITAVPYFLSRLSGSPLQNTFSSYLSITFTVSNFAYLARATATSRQSNFSRQIRLSLIALTVLVFLLTISTFIPSYPSVFFFLVLLNGVCQASAGAYLQTAVVALASLFGPNVIQAVVSGQAAVGVVVSFIQVFSVWAGIHAKGSSNGVESNAEDASATQAAFLFFGLSTLFLACTIALHAWLITMPVYKAVVVPYEAKKGVLGAADEREALTGGRPQNTLLMLDIASMNAAYNFAAAYVFAVTLSVFPPITSAIRSVHPPSSSTFSHPLFFTALHFLIFNIGDFVGRYLPMIPRFQFWSSRSHLIMSLSRTLFIPLFLLCNVQRPSSDVLPVARGVLINSDILFFLILLFFGVSNGYVSSLVMMAAPSPKYNPHLRHRPEDVDTAATIAQFCLVGGLVLGSFTSFGVRGAICDCNPFTS